MSLPVIHPRKSLDSEPYWEGCRQGELRFQRCRHCRETVFHARALCPYCLSDALDWERSAGRGSVYSWSLQHVPLRPGAGEARPRLLGIAALDEGFHMFAEFVAEGAGEIAIGARLEVFFDRVDETLTLPKFKVLAGAGR
ncbi:OB-fold domain-containing protein [Bosea sp. (in: a-proteobacteria)]|uniref:Zn-ribbon domain-containing OB-fold protein n=1 Tax=Bosea sp. (in: a-proteobacteria) TaxID=1871050 RepID=UPI0026167019|nr:OB-fold domain-containing protein [Bosea sp. (in: a-proteobacteria)]MCO5089667.1 OB-fold domain-containing protein [Bosea sp. (in: a-proteobacteria)]